MGKDKLKKFAENKTFRCLVQPEFDEIFGKDHPLKGRWHADFFRNDRPIVLELGCGKGEYTVALAADDPARNYIGVTSRARACARREDRHRARGWTTWDSCARASSSSRRFSRPGEVSELWITFPDPQLKRGVPRNVSPHRPFWPLCAAVAPGGWINIKPTRSTSTAIRAR